MHALVEAVTILPYDVEDGRATAVLRAALQKKGRPIGACDALITGCALARGLVLVISNESEFSRVSGLRIENSRQD
jgi:tRNA(fMet)-specific endonuclease VapC